jgi:hypothetical protein
MIIVNDKKAYTLIDFTKEFFCLIDEEELQTIMDLEEGKEHYVAGYSKWLKVKRA